MLNDESESFKLAQSEYEAYRMEFEARLVSIATRVFAGKMSLLDLTMLSVLNRDLTSCKARIVILKPTSENDKWTRLYRNHEKWKEMALSDPLTSEYLKDQIQKNTHTKLILQTNTLTTEVAKCLQNSFHHLTIVKKQKKKIAQLILLEIITEMFPEDTELTAIELDTFNKAIQRTKKEA